MVCEFLVLVLAEGGQADHYSGVHDLWEGPWAILHAKVGVLTFWIEVCSFDAGFLVEPSGFRIAVVRA